MIPTSECVCSENRVLDDDYSVVLFGMMLFTVQTIWLHAIEFAAFF